jgi:signal transduction histidine kinase
VAHEVNNPIAIVLGFTDLLLEKTPPDRAHSRLRSSGERRRRRIVSLRRLAKASAERRNSHQRAGRVLTIIRTPSSPEIGAWRTGDDLPVVRRSCGITCC